MQLKGKLTDDIIGVPVEVEKDKPEEGFW